VRSPRRPSSHIAEGKPHLPRYGRADATLTQRHSSSTRRSRAAPDVLANAAYEQLVIRFKEHNLAKTRALQASAQARRLKWNEGLALLAMGRSHLFAPEAASFVTAAEMARVPR
jgi:hypothetical protein